MIFMVQKIEYAVAIGDAFQGYTMYGPFEDGNEATEWAAINDSGESWTIVELHEPIPR